MAETNALTPDSTVGIPRFRQSEIGVTGLRVTSKQIQEEANRLFRYPYFLSIIEEMSNHATIAAALNTYKTMVCPLAWNFVPPVDATDVEKQRAKFILECMHDMEGSWSDFIAEALSYLRYGFTVHEKVFRRRLKKNGSKFNDGLVGWRKLPIRSQKTLTNGWLYSEDGRELIGVEQDLSSLNNVTPILNKLNQNAKLEIPREKFILIRCDSNMDNPEGRSILKSCYLAYKQLTIVEEQELLGLSRDLQGIPKFTLPPEFMSADANDSQKAVYSAVQKIGDNLSIGAQTSVVYPASFDERGNPLFSMELLESKGGKNFDTGKIIARKQNDVLTALSCDVLKLGADSAGSFSLADSKTSMLALAINHRLKEIQDALIADLVKHTYELNGWDTSRIPQFVCDEVDPVSLEELGKFIQRAKSTGCLEVDRAVLNKVRVAMGVPPRPEDEPPNKEEIGEDTSKSGKSFSNPTGGLEGTRNSVSGKDNSSNNVENT